MKILDVVKGVNQLLAGERHSLSELVLHLDQAVDDINTQLGSTYPAFSELPAGTELYDFFPDRYIRSAVLTGAAWYYYTTDEEGEMASQQYALNYERALFTMVRDFITLVPLEYRADVIFNEEDDLYYYSEPKTLSVERDSVEGVRGVVIDASNIIP